MVTQRVQAWLSGYGKQVSVFVDDFSEKAGEQIASIKADCVIVLGGDGTLIRAANKLLGTGIPIFGINLGTLGFLTETGLAGMERALDQLILGQYEIEERMMLHVNAGADFADTALNDIVITRSGFSRLISVRVYVNEELMEVYRGDGVIIATPTGSTGYNLSAGGPVVLPNASLIVITPICPHSLNARSIIVSDKDSLRLVIEKEKKTQEEEAIVTVDGRNAKELKAADWITIEKSAEVAHLVKLKNRTFFEILREKFRNGGG